MNNITEKWARTAPAGPELDRVCAEWMGNIFHSAGMLDGDDYHFIEGDIFPKYSTSWNGAGPLLEAIQSDHTGWAIVYSHPWQYKTLEVYGDQIITCADTMQLVIARACAVLVACGITRDDLRGTT